MMLRTAAAVLVALAPVAVSAQVPAAPAVDQLAQLKSSDPKLAANKRLVFDMWRMILEAHHVEKTNDFLAPDYIQHNPTIATGRAAFVEHFSKLAPVDYGPTMKSPLITIVAENDLVVLSFARQIDDPTKPGEKYVAVTFDMFRVRSGKIVEHWDAVRK